MSSLSLRRALSALLALLALVNLWVFARFTVDDAFITWRYGLNLVQHGVWAYNPDGFDLTQAYTNPVFAALSVLPAALGLDMVLAFKLLSLAVLAGLGARMLHLAQDRGGMALILLALLAIPATLVHGFSGLETVLYGGALGLWFIATERGKWRSALALASLLVLTRPEAWLLFGLHPLALGLARQGWRRVIRQTAILWAQGAALAGFHLWHFGHVLPNTYFITSGDGISRAQALEFLPWLLPALAVLALGNRRTGLLLTLYCGAVWLNYSGSDLLMNYLQRFAFQMVLPMALYLGWALSRQGAPKVAVLALLGWLAAFGWHTRSLGDHLGIANYYPRLLDSHVLLGQTLHRLAAEGRLSGFALADAGAAAYHADILALDPIGLASALRAQAGRLTPEIVRAYAPDVVGFHATTDGIRDLPDRHDALWTYVAETGMVERCELVWARHYTMRLFTREAMPELDALCAQSLAANGLDELRYALHQLRQPPWAYWHE